MISTLILHKSAYNDTKVAKQYPKNWDWFIICRMIENTMATLITCVIKDSSTVYKIFHTVSIQSLGTLILADHIIITLCNVYLFYGNYKEKQTSSRKQLQRNSSVALNMTSRE
jgi:hypothetical protein